MCLLCMLKALLSTNTALFLFGKIYTKEQIEKHINDIAISNPRVDNIPDFIKCVAVSMKEGESLSTVIADSNKIPEKEDIRVVFYQDMFNPDEIDYNVSKIPFHIRE